MLPKFTIIEPEKGKGITVPAMNIEPGTYFRGKIAPKSNPSWENGQEGLFLMTYDNQMVVQVDDPTNTWNNVDVLMIKNYEFVSEIGLVVKVDGNE